MGSVASLGVMARRAGKGRGRGKIVKLIDELLSDSVEEAMEGANEKVEMGKDDSGFEEIVV